MFGCHRSKCDVTSSTGRSVLNGHGGYLSLQSRKAVLLMACAQHLGFFLGERVHPRVTLCCELPPLQLGVEVKFPTAQGPQTHVLPGT